MSLWPENMSLDAATRPDLARLAGFSLACACLVLILCGCGQVAPRQLAPGLWLQVDGSRLEAFRAQGATTRGRVIVILHGDKGRNPGVIQETALAEALARDVGASVWVLARPGYGRSASPDGACAGDPEAKPALQQPCARLVLESLRQIMRQERGRELFLFGFSAGCDLAGVVAGLAPGFVAKAFLVCGEYDYDFRARLQGRQPAPHDLTALRLADRAAATRFFLVAGDRDTLTPPALTERYLRALRAHGADARSLTLPGLGHDWRDPRLPALASDFFLDRDPAEGPDA